MSLIEMSFQPSYPLNLEKASPPGTFTVYLSWADTTLLPLAVTSAITTASVRMIGLFSSSSPLYVWLNWTDLIATQ